MTGSPPPDPPGPPPAALAARIVAAAPALAGWLRRDPAQLPHRMADAPAELREIAHDIEAEFPTSAGILRVIADDVQVTVLVSRWVAEDMGEAFDA
jgi:hypothetical protein